jgi:hypothetical protein
VKTFYYKGEDIDEKPGNIIKVKLVDDLVDGFLELYPNYIKDYVSKEK